MPFVFVLFVHRLYDLKEGVMEVEYKRSILKNIIDNKTKSQKHHELFDFVKTILALIIFFHEQFFMIESKSIIFNKI